MGLRWGDNVVESSTATTTGAYQLAGVPSSGEKPGAQTFVAGIGNANTCYYRAEEVGGTAWEEGLGTVTDAATDTLTRTRIDASSNSGSAVNWTGKTVRIYANLPAYAVRRATLDHAFLLDNVSISVTRSGNAESFRLLTAAGADPSAADPVRVAFANTSGGFDILECTSALSVTLSSGSTGGAIANLAFKVAVLLLNNAGTMEMAVVVRPSGIRDNSIVSTTAEGGAGGAGSPRVIYSTTARTNVRCRVLGYATYTLATPGTWNTAPSDILLTRAGAVEMQVKELLYQKTLTANGVFDTNEWWPGGTLPNGYDSYEIESGLRAADNGFKDSILQFNGDATAANYRTVLLWGVVSSSGVASADNFYFAECTGADGLANCFASAKTLILGPSLAHYKDVVTTYARRDSDPNYGVQVRCMSWESTAAINRMVFKTNGASANLASGSFINIYGLKTMTVLS